MNAIDRALYRAAVALSLKREPLHPANAGMRHAPWHPTARVGPYRICRHPDCPVIVVA